MNRAIQCNYERCSIVTQIDLWIGVNQVLWKSHRVTIWPELELAELIPLYLQPAESRKKNWRQTAWTLLEWELYKITFNFRFIVVMDKNEY